MIYYVVLAALLAGCPAPAAEPTDCARVKHGGPTRVWLYRCTFPDAVCYMTDRGGVACHFDVPERREPGGTSGEVNGAY